MNNKGEVTLFLGFMIFVFGAIVGSVAEIEEQNKVQSKKKVCHYHVNARHEYRCTRYTRKR